MFNPFPLIAACLLMLAGCGQKGPLYLPGDPSEMQTEIPEIDTDSLPGGDQADEEANDDTDNDQSDDTNN